MKYTNHFLIFSAVALLLFSFASPALAATLYFSAPTTISVGEIFSLDVLVDSNDRGFNAGEASIIFPNDILEVVSVNTTPSSTIFNFWLSAPSFSNEAGLISFSGGTTQGIVGPAIPILSVNMRAKGSGDALVTASDASINASDGSGTNILNSIKASRIMVSKALVVVPSKTAPKETIVSPPTPEPEPEPSLDKDPCLGFFTNCEFPFPTIKKVSVELNREIGSDIFVSGTAEEGANVRLRLYRDNILSKEILTIVDSGHKWEGVLSNIPAYGVYAIDAIAESDKRASQPTEWTDIGIFPPYTLHFGDFVIRWYFIAQAILLIFVFGFFIFFLHRFLITRQISSKKMTIITFLISCLALVGVSIGTYFLWEAEHSPSIIYWKNTDIPCIHRDHSYLDTYYSAKIEINVDGVHQRIPTEIGISPSCVAQIHTHDDIGNLHFEETVLRPMTLVDFFTVAGEPIEREGYNLSVTINGKDFTEEISSYALKNEDVIVVKYSTP